ncbi:MAG: hypothetical protein FJW37_14595 [Acidobacteria bacterium]|nr:hypothetical protein [Acidobacteriota bacterium]
MRAARPGRPRFHRELPASIRGDSESLRCCTAVKSLGTFLARNRNQYIWGPVTDSDLLGRSASGNESAFAELYRRHQGGIYRFCLRMTGSKSTAEDITQDVFLALNGDPPEELLWHALGLFPERSPGLRARPE